MVGTMENIVSDACAAVRRAERASQAPLCPSADGGTHISLAAPLECGEVNHLTDGDPPARLTYHQVLRELMTDQLETRRLGGGGAHNSG